MTSEYEWKRNEHSHPFFKNDLLHTPHDHACPRGTTILVTEFLHAEKQKYDTDTDRNRNLARSSLTRDEDQTHITTVLGVVPFSFISIRFTRFARIQGGKPTLCRTTIHSQRDDFQLLFLNCQMLLEQKLHVPVFPHFYLKKNLFTHRC